MYAKIQAARSAGLSEKDIIFALKEDSNLGRQELSMILQGKFSPIKPSRDLYEAIYKEANIRLERRALNKLPVREMVDIYGGLLGKSLLSGSVEDPRETPTLNVDDISSTDIPTLNIEDITPSATAKPSTETRTNPAFLGSNPVDILKNLTIGTRTQ
jgi:hypothetical protein